MKKPIPLSFGPPALRNKFREVIDYAAANKPVAGANMSSSEHADGIMMNAHIKRDSSDVSMSDLGGGSAANFMPFGVYEASSSTEEVPQVFVNENSQIWRAASHTVSGNRLSVAGLNSAIDVSENDYIWVDVSVSSLTPSAPVITKGDTLPAAVEIATGVQIGMNIAIAKIVSQEDEAQGLHIAGGLKIIQLWVAGNIVLMIMPISSNETGNQFKPTLFPFPFWGV